MVREPNGSDHRLHRSHVCRTGTGSVINQNRNCSRELKRGGRVRGCRNNGCGRTSGGTVGGGGCGRSRRGGGTRGNYKLPIAGAGGIQISRPLIGKAHVAAVVIDDGFTGDVVNKNQVGMTIAVHVLHAGRSPSYEFAAFENVGGSDSGAIRTAQIGSHELTG